ncbi:hypothetical protein IFM12275_64930 [Nocardia sputorum]|nr:hypothetical protein IFM12275_64930 [Nocardia sputorum]
MSLVSRIKRAAFSAESVARAKAGSVTTSSDTIVSGLLSTSSRSSTMPVSRLPASTTGSVYTVSALPPLARTMPSASATVRSRGSATTSGVMN